jgi:hypothetical protein
MNILSRLIRILIMTRRDSSSSHGKILLELVLAGPILLMIPAAVIEYARFIRFSQEAIVLSQEAANRVYRQCTDFYEVRQEAIGITYLDQETRTATLRCVQNIRNDLDPIVKNRLGDASLVLSVFRHNIGNGLNGLPDTGLQQIAVAPAQDPPPDVNSLDRTRIITRGLAIGRLVNDGRVQPQIILADFNVVRLFRRFAIAEVQYNYVPMIGLFRVFFNVDAFRREGGFREVTIL